MQWFPDKKGLAMGTLVAGFGGGVCVCVRARGEQRARVNTML